jgi:hypothetical protein
VFLDDHLNFFVADFDEDNKYVVQSHRVQDADYIVEKPDNVDIHFVPYHVVAENQVKNFVCVLDIVVEVVIEIACPKNPE